MALRLQNRARHETRPPCRDAPRPGARAGADDAAHRAADAAHPGSGAITFANEARTPRDQFINKDECENSRPISLQWSPAFDTSLTTPSLAGGSYTLYASDQADNATVNTGNCPTQDGDRSRRRPARGSGPGPPSRAPSAIPSQRLRLRHVDHRVGARGQGACTATGQVIMLCVQARDSGSTPIGTARVRLTVDVSSPSPPDGVTALPGDNAANVSWGESPGTPTAEYYQVDATSIGTIDPGGFHPGPPVTGTKYRLGGLVNGATYVIGVRAFSTADNPSNVTTTVVTAEQVNDFWDSYQGRGRPGGRRLLLGRRGPHRPRGPRRRAPARPETQVKRIALVTLALAVGAAAPRAHADESPRWGSAEFSSAGSSSRTSTPSSSTSPAGRSPGGTPSAPAPAGCSRPAPRSRSSPASGPWISGSRSATSRRPASASASTLGGPPRAT